ncbi:hypothetical protein ZWY2020_012143 [Hordeum vulgare]|nr:hypothetical protein ZWY2020_012143 [Hordeum vulgare]
MTMPSGHCLKCRPTTASRRSLLAQAPPHGARRAATSAGPRLPLLKARLRGEPSVPAEARPRDSARRAGARRPPLPWSCVLAGAQSRHAIFREELVRRAYYTTDEAHRGHSSQPAARGSGLL